MHCSLCDLPTPDPPVEAEDIDGVFCCRGCLEVARTLGSDDTACERTDSDDTGGENADTGTEVGNSQATDVLDRGPDDADGETAFLSVAGMHCGTCEAFLEARATDHEGIRAASASYPSETVRITYDPTVLDTEELPDLLGGVGYETTLSDGASGPVSTDSGRQTGTDRTVESGGRLLIGGFFAMLVMLWYVLFLYPAYLDIPAESLLFDLSGTSGAYLLGNLWLCATVVLGLVGAPVFRGAYVSVRARVPNMDLLVAIAAGTAYLYSTAVLILGHTEVYFDVAVVIVMAVAVGNCYEGRVRRGATDRLSSLTEQRVPGARRRGGRHARRARPSRRDRRRGPSGGRSVAGHRRVPTGPGRTR